MATPITKLMTLTDALQDLPSVKPRAARRLILEWERLSWVYERTDEGLTRKPQSVKICSYVLGSDLIAEMCSPDDSQSGKTVISPRAAATLVSLYQAGLLPMDKAVQGVATVGSRLSEYASSGLTLADVRAASRIERERVHQSRLARLNKPLDEILESELTETYLHDLFLHHKITNGTLRIAGIEVAKTLSRSSSNSGKSHGWNERFSWTGTDGIVRSVGRDSVFSHNRRNDEERNWGLGRE